MTTSTEMLLRSERLILIARVATLEELLRKIIDDASPCTTACCVMVEESLINEGRKLLEKTK